MLLPQWMHLKRPLIGMLHAPALPGSPGYQGDFKSVRETVLCDAETLVAGGVDGLMLENYGDTPFYPGRVPAVTVAALASLATDLRAQSDVPLGINVLRNDGLSAIAIAAACGASFVRINVLCGARVADQGLIQGIAHDVLRERANLRATSIKIWADVDVKHSAALAVRSLSDEVHDLIQRGHADAVIVSGVATGKPTDLQTLRDVKAAAEATPVIVGSGVSVDQIPQLAPFASAFIVGTSLKREGNASQSVELARVKQLVDAVRVMP